MRYTTKQLQNKMEKIVKDNVKHYQSDFYKYDLQALQAFDKKKYDSFIWIIRECGTHFIYQNIENDDCNYDYLKAVRNTWPESKEFEATLIDNKWSFCQIR